jgi:hypothetical protein
MPAVTANSSADQPALRRLRRLVTLLDNSIPIPGTSWRIGLDAIIGLIPGAGDLVTTALAVFIVIEAHRMGVRGVALGRMIANVAIDFLVGAIPLIGDLFDAWWKCNVRNLRVLEAALARARAVDRGLTRALQQSRDIARAGSLDVALQGASARCRRACCDHSLVPSRVR